MRSTSTSIPLMKDQISRRSWSRSIILSAMRTLALGCILETMLETGKSIMVRLGMKLTDFRGNIIWSDFTMVLLLVCTIASMLMVLASSGMIKEST